MPSVVLAGTIIGSFSGTKELQVKPGVVPPDALMGISPNSTLLQFAYISINAVNSTGKTILIFKKPNNLKLLLGVMQNNRLKRRKSEVKTWKISA